MTREEARHAYITWGDCIEWLRYLEQGYAVKINVVFCQTCPKGEQFPKLGFWLQVTRESGETIPGLPELVRRFPGTEHRTVPALVLFLLHNLDTWLSEHLLWTEPLATTPRKA